VISLRKIIDQGKKYYFIVSPSTLSTRLIPSDSILVIPETWDLIRLLFRESPYINTLKEDRNLGFYIQDAGFVRVRRSGSGIDLTVDLCPSSLPLDRIVFSELIREIGKFEKPVPIAVCVTGRWIQNHPRDLKWIDSLTKVNELSVIWINHTFNHFTYKGLPLMSNFLLSRGTNVCAEVLDNERLMIGKHILPSVFFRFPGLVSDPEIFNVILDLGLIPVGSDAWLAKGQIPGNGSIVLIHANGNEPVGIREFIKLLKKEAADVRSGRWELFDLRESLVEASSPVK
jgi:hypothetical protein